MNALAQLIVLLLPLLVVVLILLQPMGLRSKSIGWMFVGSSFDDKQRLRDRRGRFISMRHLANMSPLKKAVVQAVGAADIAALAFSAAALASLGLQGSDETDPQVHAVVLAVVGGVCVLTFAHVLADLLTSVVIFLASCLVVGAISGATSSGTPLLALVGMALALAGPWPIGLLVFLLELISIGSAYGNGAIALTLILTGLLVAFALMIDAAKSAGTLTAIALSTAAVFLFVVLSGRFA